MAISCSPLRLALLMCAFVAAAAAAAPIRGVNLGGWLVMEPWITPTLFDLGNVGVPRAEDGTLQVVDEWTWHDRNLAGSYNRTRLLVEHWETWVTKEHLETLAKAGITHLRIPVGYWYWNHDASEPFANAASLLPYALERLKLVVNKWAAPLGLQVLLDLHTAPGSQNGFDNSGRRGDVNLLSQPDGSPHTQNMARWEQTVATLARWAVEELDPAALWGIEVLNEPFGAWGKMADAIKGTINPKGYQAVRNSSADLNVVFQTGFISVADQDAYLEPAYRNVWFDDHNYQCFGDANNALAEETTGWDQHLATACEHHYDNVAGGIWSFVGEFSLAVTDCQKYLASGINGGCNMDDDPSCVYSGTPTRKGIPATCKYYTMPAAGIPPYYKEFLLRFARAQMDSFEASGNGWFFWNFRTEDGHAPAWDFLLGLEHGWIDPDVGNRPVWCGSKNATALPGATGLRGATA